MNLIPLSLLRAGQSAWVGEVIGSNDLVHRLQEMGFRRGAEIRMVRPGAACIICLGRQKLCFRGDEGMCVLVDRAGVAAGC